MVEERMTIHAALSELKILDERIIKAINDGTYCVPNKHSNEKIKGVPISDYCETIKGFDNKVIDLTKRRNAIRRAVQESNAITKVQIDNENYTVAVAIEMKNHGIELEEIYYNRLKSQYFTAQKIIETENSKVDERADKYIESLHGNKEASKVDGTQANKDRETYVKNNQYELIDPLKILNKMSTLEEKISKFKSEVDAALSVSNAKTEISISY